MGSVPTEHAMNMPSVLPRKSRFQAFVRSAGRLLSKAALTAGRPSQSLSTIPLWQVQMPVGYVEKCYAATLALSLTQPCHKPEPCPHTTGKGRREGKGKQEIPRLAPARPEAGLGKKGGRSLGLTIKKGGSLSAQMKPCPDTKRSTRLLGEPRFSRWE